MVIEYRMPSSRPGRLSLLGKIAGGMVTGADLIFLHRKLTGHNLLLTKLRTRIAMNDVEVINKLLS